MGRMSPCPATRADGDELRQLVKARVDEINQALLKGDYGKVADLNKELHEVRAQKETVEEAWLALSEQV